MKYMMLGKPWKSINLIFHQRKKYRETSALSNCHECDNRTPKRPVIENKTCNNRTPKLNMACVDARHLEEATFKCKKHGQNCAS